MYDFLYSCTIVENFATCVAFIIFVNQIYNVTILVLLILDRRDFFPLSLSAVLKWQEERAEVESRLRENSNVQSLRSLSLRTRVAALYKGESVIRAIHSP